MCLAHPQRFFFSDWLLLWYCKVPGRNGKITGMVGRMAEDILNLLKKALIIVRAPK
jgi:hypothetical protein